MQISERNILETKMGSVLAFILLVVAILIVYFKNSKRSKKTGEQYLGVHDLPKIKNTVPLKLIGVGPQFWNPEKTLISAERVSNEYGDIFYYELFGMEVVTFNSGPVLQTLLTSTDFEHLKKIPFLYEPLKPFVTNSILVSQGLFWQNHRRILMKTQSYQNLKAYTELLNRHSKTFVKSLEDLFGDGKLHTINELINVKFLEIISEIVTGKAFEQRDELKRYHHNFNIWKGTVALKISNPLLYLKPIWFFHPRSKIHDIAEAELFAFARQRIKEQKEMRDVSKQTQIADIQDKNTHINPQKQPPFRSVIDVLLDAGINECQMVDEVNVMMFGGHETGAGALHCLLFALAMNQHVQEEARKEVDEFFENPSNFSNDNITFDAAQSELKYVERCILEALRLFPPIFINGRKLEKPLKVGYKNKTVLLPAGTNIIVCPFQLHRRPEYFPEPHKFDPDRFLPEEMAKRHTYCYLPFSAGPRNCIGKKLAMLQLKIMTAYILRHFEMMTTDKFEDTIFLPHTTLTPLKDFTFEFKSRFV